MRRLEQRFPVRGKRLATVKVTKRAQKDDSFARSPGWIQS